MAPGPCGESRNWTALLQSFFQLVGARLLEAGGPGCHGRDRVAVSEGLAAGGANDRVLEVGQDVGAADGRGIALPGFSGPLLDGTVNLLQIGDASLPLGRGAGLHEVGDRDRGQKTDNGHDDHDLHQGEASRTGCASFHDLVFLLLRRERGTRRLL